MSSLIIRNLSPETHRALKERARVKGISTAAEIRLTLDSSVPGSRKGLGTALYEATREFGGIDVDFERDQSPMEPADFE